MNNFHLKIVSPDGCLYEGEAQLVTLMTTQGEVSILANHASYVAAIGMGRATVVTEEGRRYGSCIGGMLMVSENKVNIVATTFEWKEDIDVARAQKALTDTEAALEKSGLDETQKALLEAKRKRAKVRLSVAQN